MLCFPLFWPGVPSVILYHLHIFQAPVSYCEWQKVDGEALLAWLRSVVPTVAAHEQRDKGRGSYL